MADPAEQDRVYREQIGLGKSEVYARAFASKAHEGELFAKHYALLREKRANAKSAVEGATTKPKEEVPPPAAASARKRKPEDFTISKPIGNGSYSTVYLATEKETKMVVAIKVVSKALVQKENKQKTIIIERDVFNALDSPFFVRLFYTFQDQQSLYFVIEYAENGELLNWLKKLGSFDEDCSRFYLAEIVLALEHMHARNIIHRDLKPENILLDKDMHVKITDFGTAKILKDEDEPGRADSFVGTAQYVSPELLSDKTSGMTADLWALGCIAYQLLSGGVPFIAGNDYHTFRKIQNLEYSFPPGFSELGKDLVEKLLVLEPTQRLGAPETGGYDALKAHPFFAGVDWDNLAQSQPPKLEAFLPAISEEDKPLHESDAADDELAAIEAAIFRKQMGAIEVVSKEDKQRQEKLKKQAETSPWHKFLEEGELIVRTGLVDKRKGLFSKRRQLILTDTPRLIYIDPEALEIKGEIQWSAALHPQFKTMKTFFVHTPDRTYYLEDVERKSIAWVDTINHMLRHSSSSA
eukprot:m.358068 g.358068  ORF g.358068 m.358068 type:complete len:524 (-) comp18030_c0_seq1:238-1809(-)